jgi:ABC-2 type transport system permease protein
MPDTTPPDTNSLPPADPEMPRRNTSRRSMPATTRPAPPRRLAHTATNSLTLTDRNLRLSWRKPDALLTSLLLPVMLMMVFVYLFGGAIQPGGRYVTYVVPGVVLLCVGLGSSTTAVSVAQDIAHGTIDRFISLDIGGAEFLSGQVGASLVRNIASTTLVFVVAFLIGFQPTAGALSWVAVVGMLLLLLLTISWLSALVGLLVTSPEAASGFTFLVLFVSYLSSAFVPISTMPSWLRGFARNQPASPIIETLRGLLLHRQIGSNAWSAVAWCAAILLASIAASGAVFQRRTT